MFVPLKNRKNNRNSLVKIRAIYLKLLEYYIIIVLSITPHCSLTTTPNQMSYKDNIGLRNFFRISIILITRSHAIPIHHVIQTSDLIHACEKLLCVSDYQVGESKKQQVVSRICYKGLRFLTETFLTVVNASP